MKQIFILTLSFLAINAFGQSPINKSNGTDDVSKKILNTDTLLKVVYAEKTNKTRTPAYFLNDKFVSQSLLLNPNLIGNIKVVKENIQVDNVQYYGQIHIKTKNNYSPKIISLTNLKDKYTNLKDKATIFMIDGNILDADYDKYLVDENYLLTIIVDKIENPKANINLNLIKLLTKSEENIKKSKEIRIRGTEVALTK